MFLETRYFSADVVHTRNAQAMTNRIGVNGMDKRELKKDIEWLREEVNKLPLRLIGFNILKQLDEFAVNRYDVMDLIDQLDEPETLSKEWVDNNEEMVLLTHEGYDDLGNVFRAGPMVKGVPSRKLQNILVPKQELPVIPQFVAEWYESEGKRSSWWNWFYKWGRDKGRTELETKTVRWMQDFNEELFVDMFRHGYEVEEEQKLTARDVIEKHIELLKKQEEAVNLKPYYDLLGRVKNE